MGGVVRMVCGVLLLVETSMAQAQCPDDPMQFADLVDSMEAEPTAERRTTVAQAVRCMHTVPRRRDLARAYVMMGADVYETAGRYTSAAAFFCAARGAQPDIVAHPALVPEDGEHPLRRAWQGRCPVVLDPVHTPVSTWVDAQETSMVPGWPASRPYLIQYQREDGSWTSELVLEGDIPSLPEEPHKRRERWVAPTIGVVALAGLAAAVWYGASVNGRNPGREEW